MSSHCAKFESHPSKTVGGVAYTRLTILYALSSMCMKMTKGHNSNNTGGIQNSCLHVHLPIMSSHCAKFESHTWKTVRGVASTRLTILYALYSICMKMTKGRNSDNTGGIQNSCLHAHLPIMSSHCAKFESHIWTRVPNCHKIRPFVIKTNCLQEVFI